MLRVGEITQLGEITHLELTKNKAETTRLSYLPDQT
jgi:hypothetical protein